jgi:hypothetical protein
MWAHETITVVDREEPQSFVVDYERGVQVEGRIVDMRPLPATAQNRVIGSSSSEVFGLSPSAIANRSFGPPFHQTRQHCELWNLTPNIGGGFTIGGLPPETELTLIQKPVRITVPVRGGNVGDIVLRNE